MRQSLIVILAFAMLKLTAGCATMGSAFGKGEPLLYEDRLEAVKSANPAEKCLVAGIVAAADGRTRVASYLQVQQGSNRQEVLPVKAAFDMNQPFSFLVDKGNFSINFVEFVDQDKSSFGEASGGGFYTTVTQTVLAGTYGEPWGGRHLKDSYPGHHGTLPAAYTQECKGGFIWLGVHKYSLGGLLSKSSVEEDKGWTATNDAPLRIQATREQLAGTPWETVIK